LDAQFARVAYQGELQLITHLVELIGGWFLACFRRIPVYLVDRECIAAHGVFAPYIWFTVFVQIDLECSVGIQRPDRPKRVGSRTRQRTWTGGRRSCAGAHECDKAHAKMITRTDWFFMAVILHRRDRSRQAGCVVGVA
jgi:hypothetical protein